MDTIVTFTRAKNPGDVSQALDIRRKVFVQEQHIPAEREQDGRDPEALHVLALIKKSPIATGRLLLASGGEGKMVSVAVLPEYRGQGIGARVVRQLENMARAVGVRRLVLTPHEYLESFYDRLGYHKIPGEKQIAAHHVITMEKWL